MASGSKDADQSTHHQKYKDLISTLPLEASQHWCLRKYQGFWLPETYIPDILACQGQFVARSSDILLVTSPKSGTTWLKALIYATMHRNMYAFTDHPLLTTNPHDCIPFLGFVKPGNSAASATPRLLAAHTQLSLLPSSFIDSGCRIIYLCRDPKDVLVSWWHFLRAVQLASSEDVVTLNNVFELFCAGTTPFGPIWDHVLEYWRESQRRPEKVLFLKYEDMIENIAESLRSLAKFMGCAFSEEEEKGGTVKEIIKLCSFDKLSGLDVNKSGRTKILEAREIIMQNTFFFRKGKVGDWRNYLTLEMAQKLDEITQEKLHGSGLSFY